MGFLRYEIESADRQKVWSTVTCGVVVRWTTKSRDESRCSKPCSHGAPSPNRADKQVCITLMVEPIVRPPAAQQRITPSQQSVERPEGRSPPFGHDVASADYLAQPGG